MTQKYYFGTVTFQYISEIPLEGTDLEGLLLECDIGAAVGGGMKIEERQVSRKFALQCLNDYGSDESFFGDNDEETTAPPKT